MHTILFTPEQKILLLQKDKYHPWELLNWNAHKISDLVDLHMYQTKLLFCKKFWILSFPFPKEKEDVFIWLLSKTPELFQHTYERYDLLDLHDALKQNVDDTSKRILKLLTHNI